MAGPCARCIAARCITITSPAPWPPAALPRAGQRQYLFGSQGRGSPATDRRARAHDWPRRHSQSVALRPNPRAPARRGPVPPARPRRAGLRAGALRGGVFPGGARERTGSEDEEIHEFHRARRRAQRPVAARSPPRHNPHGLFPNLRRVPRPRPAHAAGAVPARVEGRRPAGGRPSLAATQALISDGLSLIQAAVLGVPEAHCVVVEHEPDHATTLANGDCQTGRFSAIIKA